jgi:hypothetical protein
METGQRSIELVEFCRIVHATGRNPAEALATLLGEWAANGCDYLSPTVQSAERESAG